MKIKKIKLRRLAIAILLLVLGYFTAYFFSDNIASIITMLLKNTDGIIDNNIIWSAIVGISTVAVAI